MGNSLCLDWCHTSSWAYCFSFISLSTLFPFRRKSHLRSDWQQESQKQFVRISTNSCTKRRKHVSAKTITSWMQAYNIRSTPTALTLEKCSHYLKMINPSLENVDNWEKWLIIRITEAVCSDDQPIITWRSSLSKPNEILRPQLQKPIYRIDNRGLSVSVDHTTTTVKSRENESLIESIDLIYFSRVNTTSQSEILELGKIYLHMVSYWL